MKSSSSTRDILPNWGNLRSEDFLIESGHSPELGLAHLYSGIGLSPAKPSTTGHNFLCTLKWQLKKKTQSTQVTVLSQNPAASVSFSPRICPLSSLQSWLLMCIVPQSRLSAQAGTTSTVCLRRIACSSQTHQLEFLRLSKERPISPLFSRLQ